MKKYVLIVLIILFLSQFVLSSGVYKTLDFSGDQSDPNANKILYEYILKEENMTPSKLESFANITPESVQAFEVDLNDDGENEIVGLIYSTFCWGTAGFSLFILQKQTDGYKDISYVLNFEPNRDFYIFNEKTNGYRNIKFYGSSAYNFRPFIAKYKNGYYQNKYQTEGLERALRQ